MARGKIDLNDGVVSPFFVISAAIDNGIVSMQIFGWDFAEPFLSFGAGAGVSTATVISILALAVAFVTNRPDFSKMGAVQTWVAIATIGLVIAPPFVPVISSILGYTIAGLLALVIQAVGYYNLSYLG